MESEKFKLAPVHQSKLSYDLNWNPQMSDGDSYPTWVMYPVILGLLAHNQQPSCQVGSHYHLRLLLHRLIHFTHSYLGCPAAYVGLSGPTQVEPDSDLLFFDQGPMFLPNAPLLPLFESVKAGNPFHDFTQYDIITDRKNLKKLLKWISGSIEFYIDIECNGHGGLIFRRWEPKDYRQGSQCHGNAPHYRVGFEAAVTIPIKGLENVISHQRIVSYVSDA
jgi:hypothetical protein